MSLQTIKNDIQSVFDRDPAARSTLEILLAYRGYTPSGGIAANTGCGFMGQKLWRAGFRRLPAFSPASKSIPVRRLAQVSSSTMAWVS